MNGENTGDGELSNVRLAMGAVVLLIGVFAGLWLLTTIYQIYHDPSELELFARLIPNDRESTTLAIQGQTITIPPLFIKFMAYSTGSFLLFIVAVMAGAFMSTGANIMGTDRKLLRRLDRKISQLSDRFGAQNR